jgi:hypothetical protein
MSSLLHAEQHFCLLTIPKCGTGLINKFFELTTTKRRCSQAFREQLCGADVRPGTFTVEMSLQVDEVETFFTRCQNNNVYAFGHLNYALPFMQYIDNHPEYQCVLQIRDLRDACISMVFWKKDLIDQTLGKIATFDEALMFVICGSDSLFQNQAFNIKASAERALLIMNHPNVIVSRYEDLVGDRGGGSKKAQKQLILNITRRLNIPMSPEKLSTVMATLWGNDAGPKKPTFREGKIGAWKKQFKSKHKKAFKEHFGDLLIRMGYEKNNNW